MKKKPGVAAGPSFGKLVPFIGVKGMLLLVSLRIRDSVVPPLQAFMNRAFPWM
jgi:hypothetical protein